jgi:flagellar protein FliT
MNNQEILAIYQNVAHITGQMLSAASNEEWDQFTELEKRCSEQVKSLQQNENPLQPLSETARSTKVSLIKKILEDDRRIREITEPWMARLSLMMKSVGREKKLAQAYGANPSR